MNRKDNQPKILERDVVKAVTEFLQLDGWRTFKTDPVSDVAIVRDMRHKLMKLPLPGPIRSLVIRTIDSCVRGKGFGEIGMPDYFAIRYGGPSFDEDLTRRAGDEFLWLEFKRPGVKPPSYQTQWHEAERRLGAAVMVVSDIDAFLEWYTMESGYKRRVTYPRKPSKESPA